MQVPRPIVHDDEHRVLKFRPRASDDLREDEPAPQATDEPDDFRERMITNVVAFVVVIILTGLGIWLAVSISDLRKSQDCVLMGRRDCARVGAATAPPPGEPTAPRH